jgi:hypothetical protein
MKFLSFAFLCFMCVSAVGQTPTPDPVGGSGPGSSWDCASLANIIRLTRDFGIPGQEAKVDAAYENWLTKSELQLAAQIAMRDCAPADYNRMKLIWQASVQATTIARAAYEGEKVLLDQIRVILAQWVALYDRKGC